MVKNGIRASCNRLFAKPIATGFAKPVRIRTPRSASSDITPPLRESWQRACPCRVCNFIRTPKPRLSPQPSDPRALKNFFRPVLKHRFHSGSELIAQRAVDQAVIERQREV